MFWPAVTLGYFQVAFIARMTRSSILEVLVEEYIRTARAKGLREQMVVMKHALAQCRDPDRHDREFAVRGVARWRGGHGAGLQPERVGDVAGERRDQP